MSTAFAILVSCLSPAVLANVQVVSTTADSGPGSLRDAILAANQSGATDIDLRSLSGSIALQSALPEVTGTVRFLGPGVGALFISGNQQHPILAFAAGSTGRIERLHLWGALATGYRNGGAIANSGSLTVESCLISGNRNEGGWGGGIYNEGDLVLIDCTISENVAVGEEGAGGSDSLAVGTLSWGPGGGGAGMGGGIFQNAGSLVASNCLFVANEAVGGVGGGSTSEVFNGRGGGILGGAPGTQTEPGAEGGFGGGGGGCGHTLEGKGPPPGSGGFGGGAGGGTWRGYGGARSVFGGGSSPESPCSGGGGGAGMGAAIFARGGTVAVFRSRFTRNVSTGGSGGEARARMGESGGGFGAAICSYAADVNIVECRIVENRASGGVGRGYTSSAGGGGCGGVSSGRGGEAQGAGVLVYGGTVRLTSSLLSSNLTGGGSGGSGVVAADGGDARGGAISAVNGEITLRGTSVHANSALGGGTGSTTRTASPNGGNAHGGALWVGGGKVELENCTLSANQVRGADTYPSILGDGIPGASGGGALAVTESAYATAPMVRLRYCTVAYNEAAAARGTSDPASPASPMSPAHGGGIHQSAGVLRLEAVICAGNRAPVDADVHGIVESIGRNLIQQPGDAGGFVAGDLLGIDPLLVPLKAVSDLGWVHLLPPGSPARDAAEGLGPPATDQRGVERPQGLRADLGAVEGVFVDPSLTRVTSNSDSGPGSLREAMVAADTGDSTDIDLSGVTGVIELLSPLPRVTGSLRIVGPGADRLSLSGGGRSPILSIAATASAHVGGLTLSDAFARGYVNGGAVSNSGILTLEGCVLSNNRLEGGWGAGVYNQGDLAIFNCLISTNSVQGEEGENGYLMEPFDAETRGPGGGAAGMGGGVFHERGSLTVSNCVFAGNGARGGDGGSFSSTLPEQAGRGGGPLGGQGGSDLEPAGPGGFGSGGGGSGGASTTNAFDRGAGGLGGGAGGSGWNAGVGEGGFGGGGSAFCRAGAGGGGGLGGALFARSGRVTILESKFNGNVAEGGSGGVGPSEAGDAGDGMGAVAFVYEADVELDRCLLTENKAIGGVGRRTSQDLPGVCGLSSGEGGEGQAAGFLVYGGSLGLKSSLAVSNLTLGGPGGDGVIGAAGGWARGGVVSVHGGSVVIRQSSLSANRVEGGIGGASSRIQGEGGSALGGAVWVGGGTLEAENCTLALNEVQGADSATSSGGCLPGASLGGAVAVAGSAFGRQPTAVLSFCTVVSNAVGQSTCRHPLFGEVDPKGLAEGGGLYQEASILRLQGTICAGNRAVINPDVHGTVASSWRNLIQEPGTAAGLESGDLLGVEPRLAPLASQGEEAWMYRPLNGSPVVDAWESGTAPDVDQRGLSRPQGLRADLGSVEIADVFGQTIRVTTADDAGPGSLREAVDLVNARGDGTIELATGPIVLESPLPPITAAIRIRALGGSPNVISGGGRWPILSFALETVGEIEGLILSDALATGGYDGGAISNAGRLTLSSCVIVSNRNEGGRGAGIFNQGHLTLRDCTVSSNLVLGLPGSNGLPAATEGQPPSPPVDGEAGSGGGLHHETGTLVVSNCVFQGNLAMGGSGGTGDDYEFTRAAAGGAGLGGAIMARTGDVHLLDSVFTGNFASGGKGGDGPWLAGEGGGGVGSVLCSIAAETEVIRCQLAGNESVGGLGGSTSMASGPGPVRQGGEGGEGLGAVAVAGGSLQLESSLLTSNRAQGGHGGAGVLSGPGGWARGGALSVQGGSLGISRSVFASNRVEGGGEGFGSRSGGVAGSALGGAAWVGGGSAVLENCTISANSAHGSDAQTAGSPQQPLYGVPGVSLGGGLALARMGTEPPPEVWLRYCTVAFNTAERALLTGIGSAPDETLGEARGGGLFQADGVLRLEGVINAGNEAWMNPDLHGTFESVTRNLVQIPGSATGLASHDLVGVDPLLGPLTDNGGGTLTHALLPGSPAIDAGTDSTAPTTDQRGWPRPQGEGFDLGAVEQEAVLALNLEAERLEVGPDGLARIRLWVRGLGDSRGWVESSEDLRTWRRVIRLGDGGRHTVSIIGPAIFYRLALETDTSGSE